MNVLDIKKISTSLVLIVFSSIFLFGCSWFNKDKVAEEKKEAKEVFEPNVDKRVAKYRDEGGNLQNWMKDKGSSASGGTTYNFATSNIMWRATLITLKNIPLANVDYSGGIVITDWYNQGGEESIKININFLTNEVSASSFVVSSFKKICNSNNQCRTENGSAKFSQLIKDKILENIKKLKLEEEKNKKKS